MIDAVQDYIKSVINAVDPDLKDDGYVFEVEATADHNLDYTYKMNLGAMAIQRQDTAMQATIPVSLKIYKVSNYDKQRDDFANTYCKAIDITSRAMNQTLIDQTGYIKAVEAQEIVPEPILDNDITLQFTLSFIVTVVYKYVI